MAYANFPAYGYLSNAGRTDAEMQGAFEQWRFACQHTSGHGQCALNYVSPTQIGLVPHGGNRMNLTGNGYALPDGGLLLTSLGWTNPLLYIWLTDWNGDLSSVTLAATDSQAPYARQRDPEYGHEILATSGVPDSRYALVGAVSMTSGGQFTPERVVSRFNQRMRAFGDRLTGSLGFSSTTPMPVLRHTRAGFIGDTLAITATVSAVSTTLSGMVAQLHLNGAHSGHTVAAGIQPNAETAMTLVGWYTFPTDGVVVIDLAIHVTAPVTLTPSTAILAAGLA